MKKIAVLLHETCYDLLDTNGLLCSKMPIQANNYISSVIESLFTAKNGFSDRFTLVIPTYCCLIHAHVSNIYMTHQQPKVLI